MSAEIHSMLEEIVALFPETAEAIESQPEDLPTSRLEAFAAYTTKFLGDPDCSQAKKYLQYMSQRHRVGSPKERELIDVYYVEVLFWQAPKSTVEQGWPLVPENLKSLYVGFHGKPPL